MPERQPIESRPEKGKLKEKAPVERRWVLEKDLHLFETTRVGVNGERYSRGEQKYEKGKYSSEISVSLYPDDAKLEIIPFHLQIFNNKVSFTLPSGDIIDELFVGIRDDKTVTSISYSWREKDNSDYQRGETYFFNDDGTPGGYSSLHLSGPSWPTNRPKIISDELLPYFITLAGVAPKAAESLVKAVSELQKPGPTYGDSSGGVEWDLN